MPAAPPVPDVGAATAKASGPVPAEGRLSPMPPGHRADRAPLAPAVAPAPKTANGRIALPEPGPSDHTPATGSAWPDTEAAPDLGGHTAPAGTPRIAGSAAPFAAVPADLPRPVAAQITEAVRALPTGPVEITLTPEELGRVRLVVDHQGPALTVVLQADRPETLDLLRRHVDWLAEELHAQGYGDAAFAFGDGQGSRAPDDGRPAPPEPAGVDPCAAAGAGAGDATGRTNAGANGRLDLRV